MSEGKFMAAVIEAARLLGWLVYHTHDSRRSEAGFPDLVAVRGERVMFIELKAERGRLGEAQGLWLGALASAGQRVHCWTPSDWPEIEAALR